MPERCTPRISLPLNAGYLPQIVLAGLVPAIHVLLS